MESHRVAVNVHTPSGEDLRLDVDSQDTVLGMKAILHERTKVPIDCQEVLAGVMILEDDMTIASICDDSTRMLDVTLVVTYESLLRDLLAGSKQADEVLAQWMQHEPVRSAMAVRVLIERANAFEVYPGGDEPDEDVLVEEMTVAEAKARSLAVPDCRGFTFEVKHESFDMERDQVRVYFMKSGPDRRVDPSPCPNY
jgi:hypothetical protein